MGKHALILKGSACSSAILVAAVKGFTVLSDYCKDVSLFLPCTIWCGILLWCWPSCGVGYVRKVITLQRDMAWNIFNRSSVQWVLLTTSKKMQKYLFSPSRCSLLPNFLMNDSDSKKARVLVENRTR